MARTLPECPKKTSQEQSKIIKKTYIIDILTPLVGGGVEAGKNDPITLIRGTEIRGQLRFWWRASRGAKFQTPSELYQREGEIFGTSEYPSAFQMRVTNMKNGTQKACAEYPEDLKRGGVKNFPIFKDVPGYAMFPFQGKAKQEKPADITWDTSFILEISFPTHQELLRLRKLENERRKSENALSLPEQIEDISPDVNAAMWAWVNFGGLGARTRRGCGALFCPDLSHNNANELNQWYQKKLAEYGIILSDTPRKWPTLPRNLLIHPSIVEPKEAWKNTIELLKKFRQGIDIGRNKGQQPNRPGRSLWPEADSLRRITNQSKIEHNRSITTNKNAFPRAELGLPIVFHFNDKTEPRDTELYPKNFQRMASPLILKPFAIAKDKSISMIVRLVTPPLKEIQLKKISKEPVFGEETIRHPDLAAYPKSPLKNSSNGSALEAFIDFAKEQGYC